MAEVENAAPEPEPAGFLPIVRPETIQNNQVGSSSPEPNCAICLGRLENTSYTDICMHQFCFSCILTWSKIKRECPLCKQNFNSIIHNVRSENDYDQCQVEVQTQNEIIVQNYPRFGRFDINSHDWTVQSQLYQSQNMQWRMNRGEEFRQRFDLNAFIDRLTLGIPLQIPLNVRTSLDFRHRVYREMLFSAPLRNRIAVARESSPEFYRNNFAELYRLVPFIRRELSVLLLFPQYSRSYTLHTIMSELERTHIQSSAFHNVCRGFIANSRAHIFRHELWNFATSGYDVVGYDREVNYYPHEVLGAPRNDFTNTRRYLWNNFTNVPADTDNDVHIVDEVQSNADPPVALHANLIQSNDADIPEVLDIPSPPVNILTISDSSSSSSDECEIIGVVQPQDRVYELVDLSSDEDVIEISESSSPSNESIENDHLKEEEEEEEKLQISSSFHLPGTSFENNNDIGRSFTPPLSSGSTTDSAPENLTISLKRSKSPSSDADSDSTRYSTRSYNNERKRRKTLEHRRIIYDESSNSNSDDYSTSAYRSKRSRKSYRHKSSSSDSSSCYRKRRIRIPSSDSDEKERKRKSKKSKRERHHDSSSTPRKDRKSSKDKKSKKHKKRRESKHRRSEKKSGKCSH